MTRLAWSDSHYRIMGLLILVAVGLIAGMAMMAGTAAADETIEPDEPDEETFDYVEAEVTSHTWNGDARTVSIEYRAPAGTEVTLMAAGNSVTEEADGTDSSVDIRVGGWWSGASYPVSVTAETPDQACADEIERGDGTITVCEDPAWDEATFDSATAEVTRHTWTGEIREITYEYETLAGAPVTVEVNDKSARTTADDGVTTTVAKVGGWWSGVPYPVDVALETPGERVNATIEKGDGVVDLVPPEPEEHFAVAIEADEAVTAGETVNVSATVENTGEAAGEQNVSVGIADEAVSETVALDPSESTTLELAWETDEDDAGEYEATVESEDDSASTTVVVEEPPEPVFAVEVDTNAPVTEGDAVHVDGHVENVGDDTGTQNVSVSVADEETVAPVTLEPGESDTVSLTWQTEESDAGEYEAVVESEDDAATTPVSVQPIDPDPDEEFDAYVGGQDGYLHTGTDENPEPIEFTECEDFEPTEDYLDDHPDHLPEPECIEAHGTIDHENATWSGDFEFPTTVMEEEDDTLGDVYVEADIETDEDGASGTWDAVSGEIDATFTVNIDVAIYDVDEHGVPFEEIDEDDRITDETCHVPDVSLNPSSENAFETNSPFPDEDTVEGERLADDEALIVSNDFPVDGAQDCGDVAGFVDLNEAINNELGVPADPGESEVAFDLVFDITPIDPDPPELEDIEVTLDEDTLAVNEETTASVTAFYDDGSTADVTDEATIESEDPDVATVSDATVEALAAGTATIAAAYENESDTTTLEVVEPAHFAVDIEADDVVTEGETVDAEATIENTGGAADTQDVTVAIADESTTEPVSLDPDESATVSLAWETEENDAGEYEATAESEDDSASTTVVVEEAPDDAFFAVDVSVDSPIEAGETAEVVADVTNTGELEGTQDVTVSVADESVTEEVTLDAEESDSVTLEWATSEDDAGEYEAEAVTANDSDTAELVVLEPAHFAVDIEADDVVTAGETVDVEATIENTGEVEATQDVSVAIADEETIEPVTLDDGESATVSLSWETEENDAGEYEATAESEDDSASTTVVVEEAPDDAFFAVDVSVDSPIVAGETAMVTADVTNTGEQDGTQDVTVSVADESVTEEVSLAVDESDSVTLEWQTTEDDAGEYEAEAVTANDTDTAELIVQEPAFFAVDVSVDSPIEAGETAEVVADVENTGEASDTQDVTVSVAGESVTEEVSLAGDESDSVSLEWETTADDAGEYEATAESADDSDTAELVVLEPAFFAVDVSVDSPIEAGETAEVVADVENTGEVADTQDVTVSVADESVTEEVSLAGDESDSVSLEWETTADDAGEYEATAESADDSDTAELVVLEPAFFAVDVSVDSPIEAGETAEVVADVENTGEVADTQDVTVSVADESVTEEVSLAGEESDTVTLEWATTEDDAGAYEATAESADDSDTAELVVLEPAFFAVDVSVDSPIEAGETAEVVADVENTGEVAATQDVTVSVADESVTEAVSLEGDESDSVTLEWATTEDDAGAYEATAESADDSDTAELVVLEPAFFAVDVSVDSPVEAGETAEVVADVENTGEVADTQDVTVSVADESVTEEVSLEGDESDSVTLEWETTADDAGAYEAHAESADDSDTAELVVLEPAFFAVDVSVDSPIEAGETAEVVADVENTGEVADTQDVTVSVADESVTEAVTLEGDESDSVTLEWATTEDDAGAYEATAESADDSDTAELVVLEPAFFAVDVSVDSPIEAGETAEVVADVENTGEVADTQDVTVSVADESVTEEVSLEGDESDSVTLEWETTADDAGEYEATAESADDSDTAELVVLEPAFFAVDVSVDSPIEAGETAEVVADVENTGEVADTQDVTVSVADESVTEEVSLEGDESDSVTLEWATTEDDAGAYEAHAESADDSDTAELVVLEPAFFDVEITETNEPIDAGETLTVDADVENTGEVADSQDVTLEIDDEQVDVEPVSLDPDAATAVSLEWATTEDDAGSYTATVSSADDSDAVDVTIEEPVDWPENFHAYVAGEEGYLQTGTDADEVPDPIEFTECEDFEPTQDAIDDEPDYLPEPECIEAYGEVDEETGTWEGDFNFPTTIMEEEDDLAGELYVEANIDTDEDGAYGTWNQETGELTFESTVEIGVALYSVEHGTDWDDVTEDDRITDETCHVPEVDIESSTEKSYETQSTFPDEETVEGERLEDDEAFLVANDFPVGGAEDCGDLDGFVDLNEVINDELGLPAEEGENEVAFDPVFTFDVEPDPPELTVDIEDTNSPVEAGETMLVNATVENVGMDETTQTIALDIDGEEVDTAEVTLDWGETEDLTLEWETTDDDVGEHTAEVSSEDDSDSVTVSVEDPAEPAFFETEIEETNSPATVEEQIEVTTTVTNTGDETDTQSADLRVYMEEDNIGDEEAPVLDSEELTLAGDESETVTLIEDDIPEFQAGQTVFVYVSTDDDAAWEPFDIEEVMPDSFDAYVAGEQGYLQTGTDADEVPDPIEFTECEDFEPTQDAIDEEPDYLPDPECIEAHGTIDHEDNTWEGDFDFPTTIMEEEDDLAGELYVEANIETDEDGAYGTWNHETGELTFESTVEIGVALYSVDHGTDWDDVTEDDRITDDTCHVPEVEIAASTEKSYETESTFPDTDTVEGERLEENEAMLAANDFPVDGAEDCGDLEGFVDLNNVINDELGIPSPEGANEVAFDPVFDFEE